MDKHSLEYVKSELNTIEERIHYTFQDKELLIQAFTHRSYVNENRHLVKNHNERLEFLGDAVLALITSEFLYEHFPDKPEGELSELRARTIEANACHEYVSKLDVGEYLLMGVGERANTGRGRVTLIADLFEAIIGAIYLESGYAGAREYFRGNFKAEMLRFVKKRFHNWKAELQDFSQKKTRQPPEYLLVKEEGPDHMKLFYVSVSVGGEVLASSKGNSKKEAEQNAAEIAMKKILKGGGA